MNRIEEIYSILASGVSQLISTDDQIISDKIKEAAVLAREEMKEQNHLREKPAATVEWLENQEIERLTRINKSLIADLIDAHEERDEVFRILNTTTILDEET